MGKILVPSYYNDFRCKCGECRNCCCEGWGVTVSYVEYMRLLGIDCKKSLRKKLDTAFAPLEDATMERYRKLVHKYDGNCPLRSDDGLCELQKACGDKVLPSICRLYPRSVIGGKLGEGALALSCEGVVELLMKEKGKLRLVEAEIDGATACATDAATEKARHIQADAVDILQNRSVTLVERILELGRYVETIVGKKYIGVKVGDAYETLLRLDRLLEEYSPSYARAASIADVNAGANELSIEESKARFKLNAENFIKKSPDIEIFYEHCLVNHIWYDRFPLTVNHENLWDEYTALAGIYALLKYVTVEYMADKEGEADLADSVSALFRAFEHSDAEVLIEAELKSLGATSFAAIEQILRY